MATNKIMFFDIDGTILSETTHTIPKSTVEGLQKAKEQGHLIFINTGRPFSSIDECIKELDPDGYVCGCGTYIRYHDEVLFSKTLSQERCFEVRVQRWNGRYNIIISVRTIINRNCLFKHFRIQT